MVADGSTVPSGGGGASPMRLRAYRATRYRVAGLVEVRIGRRSAAMDALLTGLGARTGVLVTAWNPLSRPMPAGWNVRMQERLRERLGRHLCLFGDGSLRRWQEAHWLVAADPRLVMRLARVFRQRGVVVVARRRAARLVLLD